MPVTVSLPGWNEGNTRRSPRSRCLIALTIVGDSVAPRPLVQR
jgi:hypothetical protein